MTIENQPAGNPSFHLNSQENTDKPNSSKMEINDEISTEEFENEHLELSLSDILRRMENIINKTDAGALAKEFNGLRNEAMEQIHREVEEKKQNHIQEGNAEEDFSWEHPLQSRLSGLNNIFKEKYEQYRKKIEEEYEENKKIRIEIIEKLKNLYTHSDAETNLFKGIREIKEAWANAGQVAKNEFKILNNDYFHHLNQFYQLLDYKKEYLEQEYAHNLEMRRHIIARAKELQTEPVVQKALNELQYLHKLWKEEAEPVAEEFRDATWDEFKEISNKVHDRKVEYLQKIENERNANLRRKNEIIAELKSILHSIKKEEVGHTFWQKSIKKVEALREAFFNIGGVPKNVSSKNWAEFKEALKEFSTSKNNFYKSLKDSQISNLEAKLRLIEIAKENATSEDWETAVPLFKKLQDDWRKIGHVPRNKADKIWTEFCDACNSFFNNYRKKNNVEADDQKENYKLKKALLEELSLIGNEEGSIEKIQKIKTSWEGIGKVPKNKIGINKEFNKELNNKLKLNNISYSALRNRTNEDSLIDQARKIKNQIADLQVEVSTLENNIGFFSNPTRENPLLKDTFAKIDEKKSQIQTLKETLHRLITEEQE